MQEAHPFRQLLYQMSGKSAPKIRSLNDFASIQAQEAFFDANSLSNIVKVFGIDASDWKWMNGRSIIRIPKGYRTADLPPGYWYKGGKARSDLRKALGLSSDEVRDIDIVRIKLPQPYEGCDKDIAQKWMPEDFSYGYGVEFCESMQSYFRTRDMTINEVISNDFCIIAPDRCVIHMLGNIIQMADAYREKPDGRVNARLIRRFVAVNVLSNNRAVLKDRDLVSSKIDGNALLLQFYRLISEGDQTKNAYVMALHFVDECVDLGILPKECDTPVKAASMLFTGCPFPRPTHPAKDIIKQWRKNEEELFQDTTNPDNEFDTYFDI